MEILALFKIYSVCQNQKYFLSQTSTSLRQASYLLSLVLCAESLGTQSLPVFLNAFNNHKAEGLIVICYSLGSTYT